MFTNRISSFINKNLITKLKNLKKKLNGSCVNVSPTPTGKIADTCLISACKGSFHWLLIQSSVVYQDWSIGGPNVKSFLILCWLGNWHNGQKQLVVCSRLRNFLLLNAWIVMISMCYFVNQNKIFPKEVIFVAKKLTKNKEFE
jgi:hypothetical protein